LCDFQDFWQLHCLRRLLTGTPGRLLGLRFRLWNGLRCRFLNEQRTFSLEYATLQYTAVNTFFGSCFAAFFTSTGTSAGDTVTSSAGFAAEDACAPSPLAIWVSGSVGKAPAPVSACSRKVPKNQRNLTVASRCGGGRYLVSLD